VGFFIGSSLSVHFLRCLSMRTISGFESSSSLDDYLIDLLHEDASRARVDQQPVFNAFYEAQANFEACRGTCGEFDAMDKMKSACKSLGISTPSF
tara:strand:+ start:34 stop:318 length:285 start_codon:yes stop_codon:yes gene_type:complete